MKANRPQIERALANPGQIRFFLLHGPDEAGSRGLVKKLAASMGGDAERIDLTGTELKGDPARLADEAAAISMFGGARWILVEPAGDEVTAAVEALIEAPAAGNPVAIVSGALKPASRLLKLALASPAALAFASYLPDGRDADRLVLELAREHGLTVRPDVARRIADACGGNRAIIAQELVKFALYVDASAEASKPVDHDVVDAVGADADEGDLSRLVDAVLGGQPNIVEAELARLRAEGEEGITLIRALMRRMMLLARLRGEVEQGNSVGSVMESAGKAVFWKERDIVAGQLARWRAPLIAKAVSRLTAAQRDVMRPDGPGLVAADAELFAICRQAARLR
ncbi:DNA polymerase III subunit delta [Sphingosinicella terrae]|uniref:DNA polymerase III subunit delta n=1 Tax=Sphingosinicella terrae TaxID=2172047 RepID=UPI000E0DBC73|nr:DNA polymerase III subunit delta [Sphingosinicella terrae]